MILAPLSGDPGALRVLAMSLSASAARVAQLASVVGSMRSGVSWSGEAGAAFAAQVSRTPPYLDALADRYAAAGAAVSRLAESLDRAQPIITRAVAIDGDCQTKYVALEEAVIALMEGGADESHAEVMALRGAQRRVVADQQEAHAAYSRARSEHAEVDRAAARELRAAAQDILADSRGYRLLDIASSHSRESEYLEAAGMFVAPLGVGLGAANALADGAKLVMYGEGSWDQVATSAAIAGMGSYGKVLRRAGALGSVKESVKVGEKTVNRWLPSAPMSPQERIARSARIEVKERLGEAKKALTDTKFTFPLPGRPLPIPEVGPRGAHVPRPTAEKASSSSAKTPAQKLRERVQAKARDRVEESQVGKIYSDWKGATANGAQAQQMFTVGITLQGTAYATGKAVNTFGPEGTHPMAPGSQPAPGAQPAPGTQPAPATTRAESAPNSPR